MHILPDIKKRWCLYHSKLPGHWLDYLDLGEGHLSFPLLKSLGRPGRVYQGTRSLPVFGLRTGPRSKGLCTRVPHAHSLTTLLEEIVTPTGQQLQLRD